MKKNKKIKLNLVNIKKDNDLALQKFSYHLDNCPPSSLSETTYPKFGYVISEKDEQSLNQKVYQKKKKEI